MRNADFNSLILQMLARETSRPDDRPGSNQRFLRPQKWTVRHDRRLHKSARRLEDRLTFMFSDVKSLSFG